MREADVHLSDDGLKECGLQQFLAVCRDAGLRNVMELLAEGDGYLWTVTVASPLREDRLIEIDPVKWYERLETPGEDVTYLCKIKNPGDDDPVEPVAEKGVSKETTEIDSDGIGISLVGSQPDISDSIEEYEDAGLEISLKKIADYTGPDHQLDSVTTRQQDVLATAFDLGYFDVPREATTEDVATELDLDPSTVREHLQRAQRNLVADLFDSP